MHASFVNEKGGGKTKRNEDEGECVYKGEAKRRSQIIADQHESRKAKTTIKRKDD